MPYKDKEKQRAAWRRYYHRQKQSAVFVGQKTKDHLRRKERVAWFRAYKETLACERCHESSAACLDFHHLGGKDRDVSGMAAAGYSVKAIMAEVHKCIVLCANCHRKEHDEV